VIFPKFVLVSEDYKTILGVSDTEGDLLNLMAHHKIMSDKDSCMYEIHKIRKPWR